MHQVSIGYLLSSVSRADVVILQARSTTKTSILSTLGALNKIDLFRISKVCVIWKLYIPIEEPKLLTCPIHQISVPSFLFGV